MKNKIDALIGYRFGDTNQIEVLELLKERECTKKMFLVKCHECSKDPEVYGDAVFKVNRSAVVNHRLPCGCAKLPQHTQSQVETLVLRDCESRGYVFKGFVGDWLGIQTYLQLECGHCNNEWTTTTVSRLKLGHGCGRCSALRSTKSVVSSVEDFMKVGSFIEGTRFWRSTKLCKENRPRFWDYYCPICSEDKYVKAGLCSGVFTSRQHVLNSGAQSCRCSKVFKWTKEQKEFQINEIISETPGITFKGWLTSYEGSDSRAQFSCVKHGEWDCRASSFIDQHSRCPSCAGYGYSSQEPGTIYVLSCGEVTKIGVTNREVTSRVAEINKSSGMEFTPLFYQRSDDGSIPWVVEWSMKRYLNSSYARVGSKFDGHTECFVGVDNTQLVKMVQQSIRNLQVL